MSDALTRDDYDADHYDRKREQAAEREECTGCGNEHDASDLTCFDGELWCRPCFDAMQADAEATYNEQQRDYCRSRGV